ncbi:hypothetical protein [Vibrio crassostreae]|uniref:hypothetical protein n=1 Tax=Vibrio crassostreae TaxID=246167 RepID=UPI001B306530|nr:hypothetical protein [Vibrio crassostreae]
MKDVNRKILVSAVNECLSLASIEPFKKVCSHDQSYRYKKAINLLIKLKVKAVRIDRLKDLSDLNKYRNHLASNWLLLEEQSMDIRDVHMKLDKVYRNLEKLDVNLEGENSVFECLGRSEESMESLVRTVLRVFALMTTTKRDLSDLISCHSEQEFSRAFEQTLLKGTPLGSSCCPHNSWLDMKDLIQLKAFISTMLQMQHQENAEHRVQYINHLPDDRNTLDQVISVVIRNVGFYI